MAPLFNTNYWPMVYISLNEFKFNDQTFEEYQISYLNLLLKCKKKNEKIVLISNLTNLNNVDQLPLNYIMKQIQFNKRIYDFNKKYIRCACILCKNKSIKNILNTFFAISKPAAPFKLFRSIDKVNNYLLDNFNLDFDINKYEINFDINKFQNNSINDLEEESSDNNDKIKDITSEIINNNIDGEYNKKEFNDYFNELSL